MEKPTNIQERAFDFAVRVVKLCIHLDGQPGVPRTLSNQLLRSGTAIGANLEEGIGAQSEADYLTKVSIACKEARETLFWLKLLAATEIVPQDRLAGITDECNQLVAILTATAKHLKERRHG
ncbi:four helix bundle protein [Dissulfurimicrobium hydrothermale]|nr:four helix bundle protein [Dissulfurimicrobium hydrothermale]UKL14645.1 four helix bundle protein [Dissulfurimicrobium hydrothermale]